MDKAMKAEMKTILDYLEHNLNVSHAPENKTMCKVVALEALTALIIKWLEGKKQYNGKDLQERVLWERKGRNQLITELVEEMND